MNTAEKIIEMLLDRSEFDWWWEKMDGDIQKEIVKEMQKIIKEAK